MVLREKTKLHFRPAIFMEIGDAEMLKQEEKLEQQAWLTESAGYGYGLGSIVVKHRELAKHLPANWGTITKVWEDWPLVGKEFRPYEVRWFVGYTNGASRFSAEELFLINECVDPEILEGLKEYNTDTTDIYAPYSP